MGTLLNLSQYMGILKSVHTVGNKSSQITLQNSKRACISYYQREKNEIKIENYFADTLYTKTHLVILDGSTCLVKFEDPKVLTASVLSTWVVVFVEKKSANFITLIWRTSIPKID